MSHACLVAACKLQAVLHPMVSHGFAMPMLSPRSFTNSPSCLLYCRHVALLSLQKHFHEILLSFDSCCQRTTGYPTAASASGGGRMHVFETAVAAGVPTRHHGLLRPRALELVDGASGAEEGLLVVLERRSRLVRRLRVEVSTSGLHTREPRGSDLSRLGTGLSLRSWLLLELDESGVSVLRRRGDPRRVSAALEGEQLDVVVDSGGDSVPYRELASPLLLRLASYRSVESSRERRSSSAEPYKSGLCTT